jgi:hypothetical protein
MDKLPMNWLPRQKQMEGSIYPPPPKRPKRTALLIGIVFIVTGFLILGIEVGLKSVHSWQSYFAGLAFIASGLIVLFGDKLFDKFKKRD